jgi:hypothetical protein
MFRELAKGYNDGVWVSMEWWIFEWIKASDIFSYSRFYWETGKSWKYIDMINWWLIDPRIQGNIPATLSEFRLNYGNMFPPIQSPENGIYVMKDRSWKFVCICYQKGKLLFASFSSPWKPRPEEKWVWVESPKNFKTTGQREVVWYFANAPWDLTKGGGAMPFRTRASEGGIYFHIGFVNGQKDSHGCFRLPGWAANVMMRWTVNTEWRYEETAILGDKGIS